MINYKIGGVLFECDEVAGEATVTTPQEEKKFTNAIEAWNYFTGYALRPFEIRLRDRLEENGFDRWTGDHENYTESELKYLDTTRKAGESRYDIKRT